MNKKSRDLFRNHLIYICIFLLISILCHLMFWGEKGYIFISLGSDSTTQMLPFKSFLEQSWANGNFFWSYSYGLGGDIFSEFAYYYSTSPFFILQFLIKQIFNISLTDYNVALQWKLLLSVFKQFVSMAAMYEFLRYEDKNKQNCYNAIGAVTYGTGIWFLRFSLSFDYMTDSLLWIPLICLGIQKLKREKKSALFIASFSLMLVNSFYFGYMSCIFIGSYILFTNYEKNISIKSYFRNLVPYAYRILASFGIAAVFFMPAVYGFLLTDRGNVNFSYGILPNASDFLTFFENVFMTINYGNDAMLISLPLCVLTVFFIRWKNVSFEVRKKSILALLWFVAFFVPFFSSMMNGFSYETNRWSYIILFAVAYVLPELLSEVEKGYSLLKMMIVMGIVSIYFTIKFVYSNETVVSNYEYLAVALGFVSICIIIIITRTKARRQIKKYKASLILLFCTVALAAISHNIAFSNMMHLPLNKDVDMNKSISHSLSVDMSSIDKNDKTFFRISDRNIEKSESRRENTYLLAGEYGLSAYNSLIKRNLQDHLKWTHNVYFRYITPSYYNGLGERLFLENAWGVKYILGDETAPYGYKKIENNEQLIYENKYSLGIDLWYDSVIELSDYDSFDIARKDAAIMQAAIVEDTEKEYETERLDDTVLDIPIDFSKAGMENCKYENDKIYVERDGDPNVETTNKGIIKIDLPKIKSEGEFLFTLKIFADEENVDLIEPYLFKLNVNDKSTYKFKNDYKWTYNLNQYTFKIDRDEEQLIISLTPGVYEVKSAGLYFSSYEKLAEWTEERNKYNIENLNVYKNKITGTINNDESGILALNVPYNSGWDCYIDGEAQKIIPVDGVFMGIELEGGSHKIEFIFWPPLLRTGFFISLLSVIGCIIVYWLKKKDKKQQT